MSLPGRRFLETTLRMAGAELPVRTTVIGLENARVMVSPGSRLTPEQLRQAGPITDRSCRS